MRKSVRLKTLAVVVAASFGVLAAPALWSNSNLREVPAPSLDVGAQGVKNYFVYFNEPGAAKYEGDVAGLERSASNKAGEKFDAGRAAVSSYRSHLKSLQDARIEDFQRLLGRSIVVKYRYDLLENGITVEMTAAEAAILAKHPDVRLVDRVKQYELNTDRGPQFIGADQIWSGAATPGGNAYRGNGIVIGVLDTGVNTSHPSFANDPACGFTASNPKLLAAKDCINNSTCTGADPVDTNGHGSHTASTSGGNQHVATGGAMAGTQISGVAPCAQLITYKVCPGDTCDGAAIQAAIQTALVDKVDVLNFSISGGTSPWTDNDRGFLDLVNAGTFVAASAGNTRDTAPNPIGAVNHLGPWVMTVANSTHDRINKNAVSVAGGPQNRFGLKTAAAFPADITAQVADSTALGNAQGCTATGAFPAGSMTGKIGLISRGTCSFEEKINNARTAGAIAVVVYNNTPAPPLLMGLGTATAIPSVMVGQADGQAISTFVQANPTAPGTVDADTVVALDPVAGDNLNSGSLRGPVGGGIEVTKPDITGPGTNIYAAFFGAANSYEFLSGTSMSSPHLAGSGALVMGVRPTWTPTEVKSAMQLTAKKEGLKDYTNGTPNSGQWDADDVGNGRVLMSRAALSGLVMNETYANFLAANGSVVNQRALNLPSVRNTACTPNCTFTRTVRNTLPGASNWTAAGLNITPGMTVTVSPTSFSFAGTGIPVADTIFQGNFDTAVVAETRVLTITVTPPAGSTTIGFGEVNLIETGSRSPPLHITAAVKNSDAPVAPGVCTGGSCVLKIDTMPAAGGSFSAIGCTAYCGLVWLNQFSPEPGEYPITLQTVETIFSATAGNNPAGDRINVYVYLDNDADPANGATLVGSHIGFVLPAPAAVFRTITLSTPIVVNGPGKIIIALTNPSGNAGLRPASADTGPFANGSWVAPYVDTVAGSPPNLATAGIVPNPTLITGFSGNWLIRATGTNGGGQPVSLEN